MRDTYNRFFSSISGWNETLCRHLCGLTAAQQIVGRERRERVSQLDSSGDA